MMYDERFREFDYIDSEDDDEASWYFFRHPLYPAGYVNVEGYLLPSTEHKDPRTRRGYSLVVSARIYPERDRKYKYWSADLVWDRSEEQYYNEPRARLVLSTYDTDLGVVLDNLFDAFFYINGYRKD